MPIIPWGTLLAAAPAIARAADALLTGAKARKAGFASANAVNELAERVAALEEHNLINAELMKQMTDQMSALTTATGALAAKLRWLTIAAGAALVVSVVALGVALTR